jgi:hypothetical protein
MAYDKKFVLIPETNAWLLDDFTTLPQLARL